MSQLSELFDRGLVVRRRNRVAGRARDHDFLLERVSEDFAERLSLIKREFSIGVNLGAYHGCLSRALRGVSNIGVLVDVEPALGLLAQCGGPCVAGDEDALAFADGSLDVVVSGLSMQFVNDLPGTLVQIARALKPDGLLMIALLGGGSLEELRQSWLIAEEEVTGGASPRVAPFAELRDVGGLLQRAGFALPVVDADKVVVTYASPMALMRELKGMGASNALNARSRVPVTRSLLKRVCEVYRERFGLPNGRVPLTFEILTATGWVPHESQQKALRPGSAETRLSDFLGVEERGLPDKANST